MFQLPVQLTPPFKFFWWPSRLKQGKDFLIVAPTYPAVQNDLPEEVLRWLLFYA